MREPVINDTLQVAVVVRDLDAALRTYVEDYGIGPWEIYDFDSGNVEGMVKDDEPAEYAMRIALAMVGDVQWELIEPLDDKSMYADFLASKGEGLHHVGVGVQNFDEAMRVFRDKGHTVLQGGTYNGVTFAYLSTDRDLGVITEIFSGAPGKDQKPDAVYPPEAPQTTP
jgi:methylmalonyl-CoA/ethylmalonyl-CoA epimerase